MANLPLGVISGMGMQPAARAATSSTLSSILGGANKFLGSPLGQFATLAGLGGLQNLSQGKRDDKERQFVAEQNALNRALSERSQNVDALQTQSALEAQQRTQAAGMAGSSPLQHQSERARLDLLNRFLMGSFRPSVTAPAGIPTGTINLPNVTVPFLQPEAMASAEVPYHQAQRSLNPNLPSPDLAAAGYGDAALQPDARIEASRIEDLARSKARQAALMRALEG